MVERIGGRKIKDKDVFNNFLYTTKSLTMKPLDRINKYESPKFTEKMEEFWKYKSREVTISLEIGLNDGIIRLIEDDGYWYYSLNWFELPDYLFE